MRREELPFDVRCAAQCLQQGGGDRERELRQAQPQLGRLFVLADHFGLVNRCREKKCVRLRPEIISEEIWYSG